MARKTHGWDINNQHIFTEAVKNEDAIRRKWFQKHRQRLMDNLEVDSSVLVKSKLKKLREQQAHWDIAEPKMQIPKERLLAPSTPQKIRDFATEYMRPVDPEVLAILYEKGKTSHEARKNYLQERYKTRPEDKFYIADCTNWNYGWRLQDYPPVESSKWGQTSIVNKMFFQKNISGLKHDPNITRMPQASQFTKYKMLKYPVPRWYQELSIPQMKRVFALGKIIKYDHNETVAGRTQKILREIGITSNFVKISSKDLKELFVVSRLDPARFLYEIYRYITGSYFEEEGYKKVYDCNERIVLSAIAFLKYSETILELHRRLPMGGPMKLPKKPEPPAKKTRKPAESPYLENVTEQSDWKSYRNQLQKWRTKVNSIVKPSAILPSTNPLDEHIESPLEPDEMSQSVQPRRSQRRKTIKRKRSKSLKRDRIKTELSEITEIEESIPINDSIDDFSELDSYIKDLPKKFYPPGRENLSMKWQSWLNERDIEFEKLANKADCLLDNVRETTKLIFNPDACENCCACRQSRKKEKIKPDIVSLLLYDSLILDDNKNKHVIGSLTLNSPTPSLSDFLLHRPQIIPSEDKIVKKRIINDVMSDENGVTRYLISDIIKDIQHIPEKIRHLPVPIKNISPCNCKEDYEMEEADESQIPCAVDSECIAKKYRPNEFTGCRKCSDEQATNKIYRDFEKACKEREDRKKKLQVAIDHTTCTQRLFCNEERTEFEPESEKCTERFEAFGKCQANSFKEIIDQINKEKLLNRSRESNNSEMKEYIDNIKFSVGGIIQSDNIDSRMNGCILSGITLHTPITITPSSSSSESDSPYLSSSQHHHWSITAFTPNPKMIKRNKPSTQYWSYKTKKIQNDHVQKAIDELFAKVRQLDLLKENFKDQLLDKKNEEATDFLEKGRKDRDDRKKKSGVGIEREKGGGDIDINEKNKTKKGKKSLKKKPNLAGLMKITLKEMADEGFLFAKLPDCHKLPQLQAWIMFREGFVLTGKQKSALLEKTQHLWNQAESRDPMKNVIAPAIHISEKKKRTLTRADVHRIEQELKLKKKIFHSKIRKLRVLESRAMWNLMDYQMFPSLAFKQAYFVYQASKESDGHVERPYGFSRST